MQYHRLKKQFCCFMAAAALFGLAACGGAGSQDTPVPSGSGSASPAPDSVSSTPGAPSGSEDGGPSPSAPGGSEADSRDPGQNENDNKG
ncbi:MAG: hypothetical protein K2N94_01655 [Lachnospiraceae bacterium]|nr:hypothetical protein [Lachnospiraceae bacterium]